MGRKGIANASSWRNAFFGSFDTVTFKIELALYYDWPPWFSI